MKPVHQTTDLMPLAVQSMDRIGGSGRRGSTVSAGSSLAGGASSPARLMYSSISRFAFAETSSANRMLVSSSSPKMRLPILHAPETAKQHHPLRAKRLQADRVGRTDQRAGWKLAGGRTSSLRGTSRKAASVSQLSMLPPR
ncbi:hypothetical protein ATY31_05120 [Sinorhizobium americanum]|uniref:Uncharacterized protein n=1 Tax=Sinorhizobium americanum TaxID=194963 RepID=A0A2S3YTH4_9HYPH|nr:hypothetical protein ATY31_05120 [Sinorhizobium americanum]